MVGKKCWEQNLEFWPLSKFRGQNLEKKMILLSLNDFYLKQSKVGVKLQQRTLHRILGWGYFLFWPSDGKKRPKLAKIKI